MIGRRPKGPVRRDGEGFVVDLGEHATPVVRQMLEELRGLLGRPEHPGGNGPSPSLARLFPVVHPDDPDAEDEYQRLMREELIASKLAALHLVDRALDGDGRLDETGLVAFMQSVNSVRLVLGTMLGITDDEYGDVDVDGDVDVESSPELGLYTYLSWLLEWSVQAISSR